MQSLNIEAQKKSPKVICEPYSGVISMQGRFSLENPGKFFEPILNWVEEYGKNPRPETTFRMQMEYFNSSSSKLMMKAFRILEKIHKENKSKVTIEWYYDEMDGSMQEAGEDFDSMLEISFDYLPYD